MDCLKKGDVAIFATPPAFRWVMFKYANEKGINVFQEKPVTVDGPSTRRFLKLAEQSEQMNLKVGVGLMCRHCVARGELYDRIKQGQIGDIVLMRAYRMAGPTGFAFTDPKPDGISELMYQIKRFHAFLWASGGAFSDFLIHNIDECCWMKDAWPVKAQGSGGRHYRGNSIDQNFDVYSTEYTFADGSKLFLEGRCMEGCKGEFASYAHGSKGSAVISTSSHTPANPRIYKGQHLNVAQELAWSWGEPKKEPNPYQLEWDHLIEAIRQDKKHNEARRGAEASLVTAMGRMACHTGQVITYDQMLNCEHEFAPNVDQLTLESEAPLRLLDNGKYPVPRPGIQKKQEY
jgi:predicted dehydrogenase